MPGQEVLRHACAPMRFSPAVGLLTLTALHAQDTIRLIGHPMGSSDDNLLVERIQKKDPEALQEVVRRYLGQLLRTALAAGLERSRAEDVVQEAFTVFVAKAGEFEGRARIRTWLFGILYRKISEAQRKKRRQARTEDIDEVMQQRFTPEGRWRHPPMPADEQFYRGEVRRFLEECLDEVPPQQRMAFVLREAQGFGSKEICRILDVTATHLSVLIYRARNRLRECLELKGLRGAAK